jgi:hypothetical protein
MKTLRTWQVINSTAFGWHVSTFCRADRHTEVSNDPSAAKLLHERVAPAKVPYGTRRPRSHIAQAHIALCNSHQPKLMMPFKPRRTTPTSCTKAVPVRRHDPSTRFNHFCPRYSLASTLLQVCIGATRHGLRKLTGKLRQCSSGPPFDLASLCRMLKPVSFLPTT